MMVYDRVIKIIFLKTWENPIKLFLKYKNVSTV